MEEHIITEHLYGIFMNTVNIKNHPSIIHSAELNEICQPLKKLHHIDYFSHTVVDNDARFSGLATNPNFVEHYVNSKYYDMDISAAKSDIQVEYLLQDTIHHRGMMAKLAKESRQFGLHHTFSIILRQNETTNIYHFATSVKNSTINEYYLRMLPALQKFISYFNNTVSRNKEITSCYDIKYTLSSQHQVDIAYQKHQQDIKEFLSEIHFHNNEQYCLTMRQSECLILLLKGMTYKEIAAKLNLSPRTIEHYLEAIKIKLNCERKQDLISRAIQLGYLNVL